MLKIPYALGEDQSIVKVKQATKGGKYFCPACGDRVILKKGEIKIAHFAHLASNSCSKESIIHKTAKKLIRQVVTNWKTGKTASPEIERLCKICESVHIQSLPNWVDSAYPEFRISDRFVVDIALVAGSQAVAAIEIRVKHAVDDIKRNALTIPFIELDGNEVLIQPAHWKPLTDKFRPFRCQTCSNKLRLFNARVSEIAASHKIPLPTSYYRYSFHQCWKCKQPTLVFTWPDKDETKIPAKEPRPKVIQYRFSNTMGAKYWLNVCLNCNSIQGDFYLYGEPDGPFCGFECGIDSPMTFQEDLMKLAHYADYIGLI